MAYSRRDNHGQQYPQAAKKVTRYVTHDVRHVDAATLIPSGQFDYHTEAQWGSDVGFAFGRPRQRLGLPGGCVGSDRLCHLHLTHAFL